MLLFEGDKLGGICLNVGCILTKYLLDKVAIEKIIASTKQGIFKDAGIFSFNMIQEGKAILVDKLVSSVAQLLKVAGSP
ncbi:MAG: hypothetical protein ACOX4A_00915 [Saccharofermentanales bacterium]